jgi:outer membrane lipoprotein-sorting protein
MTKDNKVQMKIRGENVGMEMVSNGKQLALAGDERMLSDEAAKPMPTPKYLHDMLSTLVGRTGVTAGSVIVRFAPGPQFDLVLLKLGDDGFDPVKLRWGVSDFKAGPAAKVGGRDAKVISFRFGGGERGTLWLDSKTLLPLKRVYTLGRDNMDITEIYTEFNLDPKIDAKAFELVPTPNEAEKLFRATVEKIKAAQAVQVTFDCEAKGKDQGKDVEAKAKGSLLFTKDNKARLKMSTNESGKEVTIEAISDGKHWKMAESPAKIASVEEEATRKDLHSLLSTKWTEDGFFTIYYLFNGPGGPKCRLVDFEVGAAEKVGGRDAKVVTYHVYSFGPAGQVTLWIDAETLLPLKRVIVFEAARGTEICDFNLSPKVDAGAFALPK